MRIYLDNCCYNRIFDDRTNAKIYLERNSVMLILEMVENGYFDLYGSQMLLYEMNDTSDVVRKERLLLMYSLCSHEVQIDENILDRAIEIRDASNIREKDSIHLACAELVGVDVLLTVDKKFMNNANRIPAKIKVMSPTEWLMEVFYG